MNQTLPSGTRASLMQTAESLLCTRGYAAFSYADLAEAVGIRKASIHHHFPAKEDLGVAVVEAYVERVAQGLEGIFRLQLQWLQKVLDEGKAAGQLPQDADTAACARQVLGLLEGVSFIDWALNESPPSLAEDVLFRIAGVVRPQAAARQT